MRYRFPTSVLAAAAVRLALLGLLALPAAAHADACAEEFAGRTLRFVVGSRAGSNYDVVARLVGPHWADQLGMKVVFDNQSGGSGRIAMKALLDSEPDGTTVAIVSGAQTLVGALDGRLPDPVRELALLGQMGGSSYVWATAANSELRSMDDVFRLAEERPVLFATYEPAGSTFTRLVAEAGILDLAVQFVTGYGGSNQTAMAAIRQEVDVVELGAETKFDLFANGDLRPLLQVSPGEAPHPSLEGLPRLVAEDGLAARRARERGRDPEEAAADRRGLTAYLGIGRILVAHPETPAGLRDCLRAAFERAVARPALHAEYDQIGWVFEADDAEETRRRIEAARERLPRFAAEVEAAREALRR